MSYAAHIRPVIDRVYVTARAASRDRVREVYSRFGLTPGFESSFYFGLLARPMSAESFAAATTYSGSDMTAELAQGVAKVDDDGTWRLTDLGREVALAVRLTTRLGALRHHRADAHRAAWQAAGLTVAEIEAMSNGPERAAIEAETNRRDDLIYGALSADERLELLAGLGALAG